MKKEKSAVNSYLSFKVGTEEFAIHVNSVLNILELPKITKVPKAPYYMKGVINLRGNVLPVIDIRLKFDMEEIAFTAKTCIIVMDIIIDNKEVLVGSLVDSVSSVIEVDKEDILLPPKVGKSSYSEFISGMIKTEDRFIMILNVERMFSAEELEVLKEKIIKN